MAAAGPSAPTTDETATDWVTRFRMPRPGHLASRPSPRACRSGSRSSPTCPERSGSAWSGTLDGDRHGRPLRVVVEELEPGRRDEAGVPVAVETVVSIDVFELDSASLPPTAQVRG